MVVGVTGMTAETPATHEAWWPSRYGADDQAGALNEITPTAVARAAGLVRTGRVYDLAYTLDDNIPAFPGRTFHQYLTTSAHQLNRRAPRAGTEGLGRNNVNWVVEYVSAPSQMGTHMDGLNHLQIGDRAYNGNRLFDNDAYVDGEPGPGMALGAWLVDHHIALTGCDTWSFGPVPPEDPDEPFVVPQTLNVKHGVVVLENLRLAELADARVGEFMFVVSHAKLRGATGAWVAPLAIV